MSLAIFAVGVFVFLITVYGTVVDRRPAAHRTSARPATRTRARTSGRLGRRPHDRPCPSTDLRRFLTHSDRRDATAEPGPPRCGPDHRRGRLRRAQRTVARPAERRQRSAHRRRRPEFRAGRRPHVGVLGDPDDTLRAPRRPDVGSGSSPVPRMAVDTTTTRSALARRSHTALVHAGPPTRVRPGDPRRGSSTTQRAFRDPGHPRTPQRASCGRRRTPRRRAACAGRVPEREPPT